MFGAAFSYGVSGCFVLQLSEGMPLKSGQRLKYRTNGEVLHSLLCVVSWCDSQSDFDRVKAWPLPFSVTSAGFFAFVLSSAVVAAAAYQGVDFTYIHSHFLQLAVASFIISTLLSIYLYVRSLYAAPAGLALGGTSGKTSLMGVVWQMLFSKATDICENIHAQHWPPTHRVWNEHIFVN